MSRCQKSRGFTLIEILISLVILSISLLAMAGLMATTTKNNSSGGRLTEAATLAQDKLEEFRATGWQTLTPASDGPTGSSGIAYARKWNVVTTGNLKTVTVTINWSDQTQHNVTMVSVISQ